MATIFPLSASVGQEFQGYMYDGTIWNLIGNEYNPTVYSSYEPDNPKPGDLWVDSSVNVPTFELNDYLTIESASATYATKEELENVSVDLTGYLTESSASTTYATKTELENIDLSSASAAAVTYLVDGAPDALNTLNELSAALNDDESFATTVTNSLSEKLSIQDASTTYLTQSSASTTYATKNSPEFLTTVAEPNFDLPTTSMGAGASGFYTAYLALPVPEVAMGDIVFDALPSASAAFSVGDVFYVLGSDGIDNIDFTVLTIGTKLVDGSARLSLEVISNISNLSSLQNWASGYNVETNGSMWYNTVGEVFMKTSAIISSLELARLDGVSSNIQEQISLKQDKNIEIVQTSANSYTFQLSDSGKLILANGGNENVLYIPDSSTVNFPIGTQINIFQSTSPTVVVYVSDPQSTILYPSSGTNLRAQYSAATIIKIESNSWIIVGDLAP